MKEAPARVSRPGPPQRRPLSLSTLAPLGNLATTNLPRVLVELWPLFHPPANVEPLPPSDSTLKHGSRYARFETLCASAWPEAQIRLNPAFWSPRRLEELLNADAACRRVVKLGEPQTTGIAWTVRTVYLVLTQRRVTFGHVGKLLYCQRLMAGDPDYADHYGKGVDCVIICDQAPPEVIHFAQLSNVRIITRLADAPVDSDS